LAEIDDDDGGADYENIDPEQIKTVEQARKVFESLKKQQQRKEIHRRNLLKKLATLKADLEARTEENEKLQRTMAVEENRGQDDLATLKREREHKVRNQEDRIRDVLSDVIFSKAPPKVGGRETASKLDTVLVSLSLPRVRYNLSFKVDEHTTVRELRASVCRYWALSQEEHILKTMAGNKCQDVILVKECFKQGEIAQLRLEKAQSVPTEKPTDDELKAIQPRMARRIKNKNKQREGYEAGVSNLQKQHDNYSQELKRLGGIYFMLKTAAQKPTEHCSKIHLRDLVIYAALFAVTVYSYDVGRPSGYNYWLRHSFEEQIIKPWSTPNGTRIPPLTELRTSDDMWSWLTYTLPSTVFEKKDTVNLHRFNSMLGYVAIRTQNVMDTDTTGKCRYSDQIVKLLASKGAVCRPEEVNAETELKDEFANLAPYWKLVVANEIQEDQSLRLRGPSNPVVWRSSEENELKYGIGSTTGLVQTYDASGYIAEFNMNSAGKLKEYEQDISYFRQVEWISKRTRAVMISFTAFNSDFDMWVVVDILIESIPAAVVHAQYTIKPFRCNVQETREELVQTYIDYIRLVISLYILVFQGMAERHHKIGNHKAGCLYHVSLNGITDIGMVACIWTIVIWRSTTLTQKNTRDWLAISSSHFYSFTEIATVYLNGYCIEGILGVLVMYRLISFFRLSRSVYLMWTTMGKALKVLFFVCAFFLPTCLGIIFMFHSLYGPYVSDYALLSRTLLRYYLMTEGDLDLETLLKIEPTWMLLLMILVYTVVVFVVFNLLTVVVVDAYYFKFMTTPPGEAWSTARKLKWVVPGFLVSLAQSFQSQGSRPAEISAA